MLRTNSPEIEALLAKWREGDRDALGCLMPLLYEELRKVARQQLRRTSAARTLQTTALVHEAYLRLVGSTQPQEWNGRGHFFAAAAEAMRRILVDAARRKNAEKRSARGHRVPLEEADGGCTTSADELLDIDEALTRLAAEEPQAAQLIQLRYFAGLSIEDAAEVVGIARSTAYEHWSYARVRLKTLLAGG